jgi:hypothetical protein
MPTKGQRRFQCLDCGRRFNFRSGLLQHISAKHPDSEPPLQLLSARFALELAAETVDGESGQLVVAANIMGVEYDEFIAALARESVAAYVKLWLWKDGDHYLAFDSEYPTYDGGDPKTLGEPVGYALLERSVCGRLQVKKE